MALKIMYYLMTLVLVSSGLAEGASKNKRLHLFSIFTAGYEPLATKQMVWDSGVIESKSANGEIKCELLAPQRDAYVS